MTETTQGNAARLIADRYRLDRPIGQGGMGEVWAAYDLRLDRRVAVKLMKQPGPPATVLSDQARAEWADAADTARQRFLREVRTTAALSHPGTPAVHDTGEDPATGDLYLVMQLLTGAELADVIAERSNVGERLPVSWAAAVGAQVAAVLAEVHRVPVVHRDIKPRNLFLTPGGIVKVLDFGVAALLGAGDLPKLTGVGVTVGTPPYMAPEQVLCTSVGPATDLYALGCVLHEMLIGNPPFHGANVLSHHVHTDPVPVGVVRPDVPEPVEALLLALLDKRAEQRPDSDHVYETLLPFASGGGTVTGRDELNPTRPFTRPMAAIPRRAAGPPPAPAPAALPELSEGEAGAVAERAAQLAEADQYAQATDLLQEAIARCRPGTLLAAELRQSLAGVLFVAEDYRRALVEFESAQAELARHHGPRSRAVLECRYYAATCRGALGETTAALEAFQAFLPEWIRVGGADDDRTLDVRQKIGLLLASAGRYEEARAALTSLHQDLTRLRGETSPEAQGVAALLERLDRYNT